MMNNKQVQYVDEITINRDSIQIYHAIQKKNMTDLHTILKIETVKSLLKWQTQLYQMMQVTISSDQFGFYVKYDSERFHKGDKVQSIFVYNPETNYLDDIIYRADTLIE